MRQSKESIIYKLKLSLPKNFLIALDISDLFFFSFWMIILLYWDQKFNQPFFGTLYLVRTT